MLLHLVNLKFITRGLRLSIKIHEWNSCEVKNLDELSHFKDTFWRKLEKNAKRLWAAKRIIEDEIIKLKKEKGLSTIRAIVDVDPY